ncbi:MAG: hypothetical protein NPMRTHETA2_1690002 [Nitrosopumilales archaeon]|nr:MAG: hypothetical protein NPMRTHETA2_1690002 [Nitrosopumilales archaeon]
MVKPIIIAVGAIPAILALLIAVPLITKSEIPFSAINPDDVIELEYTKHQLKKISFGVTERLVAQKSEILLVKNDGDLRYTVTEDGITKPDKLSDLDDETMKKLRALIKETGFISIPNESFPIIDDVNEYQKSSLKITLNGVVNQIHWPEQNATEKFVPPIITMVESELDRIIEQLIE